MASSKTSREDSLLKILELLELLYVPDNLAKAANGNQRVSAQGPQHY